MAAPTKTTAITNLEAAKVVLGPVGNVHGRLRYKATGAHTLPFTGSAVSDVHRLLRFNSCDRIVDIRMYTDGGPTVGVGNLGLYLANDGAVIDEDFFKIGFSIATESAEATAGQLNQRWGAPASVFETTLGETLWEATGRGVGSPVHDPLEQYDLCLTISTALTVADAIIGCEVLYTSGD